MNSDNKTDQDASSAQRARKRKARYLALLDRLDDHEFDSRFDQNLHDSMSSFGKRHTDPINIDLSQCGSEEPPLTKKRRLEERNSRKRGIEELERSDEPSSNASLDDGDTDSDLWPGIWPREEDLQNDETPKRKKRRVEQPENASATTDQCLNDTNKATIMNSPESTIEKNGNQDKTSPRKKIMIMGGVEEPDEPDTSSDLFLIANHNDDAASAPTFPKSVVEENDSPEQTLERSEVLSDLATIEEDNALVTICQKSAVEESGGSIETSADLSSALDLGLAREDDCSATGPSETTLEDESTVPLVPSMPRPLKKGKKNESLRKLPESKQIFKGLVFFYIPNDDVGLLRRRRITRACEHGVVWTRNWHSKVTHIIADSHIPHKDVLGFLKMAKIPKHVAVLNEKWPAECMYRGDIIEHSNPMYLLEGDRLIRAPPVAKCQYVADQQKKIRPRKKGREIDTPEREDSRSPSPSDQTVDDMPAPTVSSTYEDRTLFARTLAEAKGFAHLPLDSEDDQSFNAPSSDPFECSLNSDPTTEKKEGRLKNEAPWQKGFTCMTDASKRLENPNANTIDILDQMAKYYETIRDQWRCLSYRRAVSVLKKQNRLISTSHEAQKLPHIGQGIADKIEEIVLTKRLKKLYNLQLDPRDKVIRNFMKIYGVGFTQAAKWQQKGFKTIDDLLASADLTENQKIGIEHLEDFETRIPREEMTKLGDYVRQVVDTIDPLIETTTAGSYRRGAKDCGDIDILLTKPKTTTTYLRNVLLDRLLPRLFKDGFLTAELASMSRRDGTKWHGACHLPPAQSTTTEEKNEGEQHQPPWRRIDFLIVPHNEIGAALLYFTGSDIFNRSMRLLARKKGMRLNQRGLHRDVSRGRHQERLTDGTRIAGEREKEIFHLLGVPWKEPWERNV